VSDAHPAYRQAGYHIERGLVPESRIDACLADLDAVFTEQLRVHGIGDPGSLLARMRSLHGAALAQYKKVMGALWRLQSVGNLFAEPRITAFLKEFFGFGTVFMPGGQCVHAQAHALKIPGGYFGLAPHQDWPSVQGSLDGLVAWVPLCEVGPGRFPLELVPGSHRSGLRAPHDGNADAIWTVEDYTDEDFVALRLVPGDVLFFSNFTVHRSGLDGPDDHLRIACSSRYDNGDEASFIERAYPSAYTRGVQRSLMHFDDVEAVNLALSRMTDQDLEQP
jgi:hypothetical protein